MFSHVMFFLSYIYIFKKKTIENSYIYIYIYKISAYLYIRVVRTYVISC